MLLEARGITKRFGGQTALDGVSLAVRGGEVLAVAGENGAGKSTLMAILSGALMPDAGQITWDGRDVRFTGVSDALSAGIGMVHQEPQLVRCLSVAENLYLGALPNRRGFVDRARLRERAVSALAAVGLDLYPERLVETLGSAASQLVAIARTLTAGARLVILDEPTSALSLSETERLFGVLRGLRAQGVSVIYISHRLEELRAIADRVAVLRDGRLVLCDERSNLSTDALIRAMSGGVTHAAGPRDLNAAKAGAPVLEVEHVTRRGRLRDVSLEVRAGECVGLAGIVGAGRSRLLRTIFGAEPRDSGHVTIRTADRRYRVQTIREAIHAGIGLVPEDRRHQGLVMDSSVAENIALATPAGAVQRGFLVRGAIQSAAERAIGRLRIKTRGPQTPVRWLSGGNQQKVVLARWFRPETQVLLLDEPTRGVDVMAKAEIHTYLRGLAAEGRALLVASSEIPELLEICDRILVMRAGAIVGELTRAQASPERVLALATGAQAA
ncbi:MAG: sugar ABC transporter ATP-binding protein [Acidobacteriota bacterium]